MASQSGGNPVIAQLKESFIAEIAAARQYTSNAALQHQWGFTKLAAHSEEEALEEMGHAHLLAYRLAFLGDSAPDSSVINVKLGTSIMAQLDADTKAERAAIDGYQKLAKLALDANDIGTFELASKLVKDEEAHWLWLEQQAGIIKEIGYQNWAQTMI